MRSSLLLGDYQHEGIDFLTGVPFAALWLDLGLGKTIIALTALLRLIEWGEVHRALIVAPLRVAAQTWPTEIEAWSHIAGTPWTLIRPSPDDPEVALARATSKAAVRRLGMGSAAATRISERAATRAEERVRERLLREETPIHIISREQFAWLVRKWGSRWPYDIVIYDEAGGLRDHTTQRVHALMHVRKNPVLKRLWELTGSPAPEGYQGLFSQIYLLDQGERFGRSIGRFRAMYFDYNKYRYNYSLKPWAKDRIIDKLKGITLVMKAEDYLPVNHPVYVDRVVELSSDELDTYQTLEEEFVASIPSGHEIVADTAGALAQKLLQYASGAVYDKERGVHWVHDHKINELRDIIEEAQGQAVLVAYWYQPSLRRLKQAFPQGKQIDKAGKLEADWSAGKIPLMFIHPASAGHGLNLQYGGHILVYFDIPYSWEYYSQTVGRIARQGQVFVPRVFHICARGTVDVGIVPILRAKGDVQDYLFRRLKRLRKPFEGRIAA